MILIATEDELSEAVAIKLVGEASGKFYSEPTCVGKKGNRFLKDNLSRYIQTATRKPVFILTDLDRLECAPALKSAWLQGRSYSQNFIFRVVVREIESWLLADRIAFSDFLKISQANAPRHPESLTDPKSHILELAKKCPRDLRQDLLPRKGAIASKGLGYNARFCDFVRTNWSPERAQANSDSLARARKRIRECLQSYRQHVVHNA